MVKPQKKNFQREIFFKLNFFGLKYVLKHSESIWKKNRIFLNVHFWPFLVIFDYFLKKFHSQHFDQKCFLIYSKSIPSKKNFKPFFKIFIFGQFLTVFDHFRIFGVKNEKIFYQNLKNNFSSFLSYYTCLYDLKCGRGPKLLILP